jgi:hypothetical protein
MTATTDLPTTPAEALRWAATRWVREAFGVNEWPTPEALRLWADELDAAPTTWALPPEPGPEVVELWDQGGERWERSDDEDAPDGWVRDRGEGVYEWAEMLMHGPLSAVPPEQTEVSDA